MRHTNHHIFLLFVVICLFAACKKNNIYNDLDSNNKEITNPCYSDSNDYKIVDIGCLTDNVILGQKLDNPYTLKNMKRACDDLFPRSKGQIAVSDTLIATNYYYVRFLPADSTEVNLLMDCDLKTNTDSNKDTAFLV